MIQRQALRETSPDLLEQQADAIARQGLEGRSEISAPPPRRPLTKRTGGLGGGTPLAPSVRSSFEDRLGVDLGGVRVHTGPAAGSMAAGLSAKAFTMGTDIVLGDGVGPSSGGGRQVLAHELVHVVQQGVGGAAVEVQRLSAADCAADCAAPDGTATATGEFSVTVFADKEGPFLLLPFTGDVGHSWLRLEDERGTRWTYGFWPKEGFDAANPTKDVDGCVHHPDTSHTPTASQRITLTAVEFARAHAKAMDICSKKPKYNLFGLQCTEFVRRVLGAAGKAPSLGFGLIWESPNALDSWLRSNSLVLSLGYAAAPAAGGGWSGSLAYRHQLFSVLGNSLRTYALGRGELGGALKTVTLGAGVELDPRRVWLPAPFVEGGAAIGGFPGGFGAGPSLAAGVRWRVDELAVVGVEYNVVRDLARDDPALNRLLFTVGLRLF